MGVAVPKLSPTQPLINALGTLCTEPGRCHISLYLNVAITVWVGQADLASAQAFQRASKELAARSPAGHSSVSFILDGLAGPTAEAQPIFKQLLAQRTQVACAAIILEGSGFWASGLRSMLNNTHREAGGGVRLKIVTAVDPIVGWITEQHQERTGVEIAPMQLRDVLLHARQIGEQSARG